MIYKATMTNGKKSALLYFIGNRHDFGMTSLQQFKAHLELMKKTGCYDSFNCASFYERTKQGWEIVCAGNCF